MKNILILGSHSATGRSLTKHLLTQTDHQVVIAGRNLVNAQALVDSLHSTRVTSKRGDAAEPPPSASN